MDDAGMGYLYTIGGYVTLIGLGYAIYHVSTQKENKRTVTPLNKNTKASPQEPRKEEKTKKKQRMETFVSDQESSNKVSKPEPLAKDKDETAEANPVLSSAPEDNKKEGLDNREFAKQLAKAQEGTKLNTKNESTKQREKSVKQSRASKIKGAAEDKAANIKSAAEDEVATPAATPDLSAVEAVPSAPSSNGADADDDESPAPSPETRPADVSGVSDMLEPTPAGPSVLRLTDTSSKKQKKKATKAPEQVETKKQRQNRKKAEAAKSSREEAEKDRKVLEEKQRRQARIAEGRPAKDGSQFMAANGTESVWTHVGPNGTNGTNGTNGVAAKNPELHEPLDTSDKPVVTAATAATKPAPKQEAKQANPKPEDSWMSSLPSEEEQMKMLKGESDKWSTVKTKASKKSKKTPSVDSGDEPNEARAAAQAKPQAAVSIKKPQNFGAFSALTTKDDTAEDDLEEEWEV